MSRRFYESCDFGRYSKFDAKFSIRRQESTCRTLPFAPLIRGIKSIVIVASLFVKGTLPSERMREISTTNNDAGRGLPSYSNARRFDCRCNLLLLPHFDRLSSSNFFCLLFSSNFPPSCRVCVRSIEIFKVICKI